MTPSGNSGYCCLTSGRLVYVGAFSAVPVMAYELTAAERCEIARYMADLWENWGRVDDDEDDTGTVY